MIEHELQEEVFVPIGSNVEREPVGYEDLLPLPDFYLRPHRDDHAEPVEVEIIHFKNIYQR